MVGDVTRSDLDNKPDAVARLLDAVSLEQALRDFEVANGRVVDLTQRLITVTTERRQLQTEVETIRLEAATLRVTLADMRANVDAAAQELLAERQTMAYQVVRVLRGIRRRLGPTK